MLKQALSDASQLNMDMESGHLAADCGAVSVAGPVEVLIAVTALERLHSAHPKVVGISAEDVHGLTKPEFDSESISIEHEDFQWGKGEVCGKQEDGAAIRVAYDDEAHQTRRRTPDQIKATSGCWRLSTTLIAISCQHATSVTSGKKTTRRS